MSEHTPRPYIKPAGRLDRYIKQKSPSPHLKRLEDEKLSVHELNEEALEAIAPEPHKVILQEGYEPDGVETPDRPEYKTSDISSDGRYERINPLSGSIFYPKEQSELRVRRLNGLEVGRLAEAAEANSTTLLLDAFSGTIKDFDIRLLTPGDFKFLMYHHRIKSFTRRPWVRKWTSRYGNRNEEEVTSMGQVLLKAPALKFDEYQEFYDRGLCVPVMRDIEQIEIMQQTSNAPISIKEKWKMDRAIYFQGETLPDKTKAFENSTPEQIELVSELMERSEHGVVEILKLQDKHFEASKWSTALKERCETVNVLVDRYIEIGDNEAADALQTILIRMENELDSIEQALANGEEVAAQVEEISVPLTAATFLSNL